MAEEISNQKRPKSRPRLLTLGSEPGERHASWLELFFDLVYVLAVAQIARILVNESDLGGFLKFAALFVPVWWSWMGFTFYADRFESLEVTYRILVFAGMLSVAALALNLGAAFTAGGDAPFVFSYVLVRLVLIALYARAAYYVPMARLYCFQFITGFGTAVGIWLASLFLPAPARYFAWFVAVVLELATPLLRIKNVAALPYDQSHIPERFGLFTIIVLGEAVIAAATGASEMQWTPGTIAIASIGFAMAACIWWLNFDFVEDKAIKLPSMLPRFVYLYGHFFIVASIVALGIGVEHAIKESGDAHLHLPTLALLGGSIAAYLTAITIIKLVAGISRLLYVRIAAISVSLLIVYLGMYLSPLPVVIAFFLILAFGIWLEDHFSVKQGSGEAAPLKPCEHSDLATVFNPSVGKACEECVISHYKWVHLRLCLECGHVGCCDSSRHKHASKHYHETNHAMIASLEEEENWAWCYIDDRFVPLPSQLENKGLKG